MQLDPGFWDRIAEKYAKSPVKDQEAYAQTLERTRAHLKPSDHVLELGAGTGTTALKLAGDVAHITATDFSPEMMRIAADKGAGTENVTFVTADIQSAPGREDGYDAVLAYNLLHLVPDLAGDLAQVAKLVKPGGLFISKTACLAANPVYRAAVPIMRWMGKAPYVRFVTIGQLEAAITQAGFEIIERGLYPKSPPNRFVVARKV